MKQLILFVIFVGALVSLGRAAVYNLKPGVKPGHWSESASWEEGSAPGEGDHIRIGAGVTVTANEADCAWVTDSGIASIAFTGTEASISSLTVDILGEANLSCAISNSTSYTAGLIKEGEGRLNLTNEGGSYNMRSTYTVNRGVLALPQGVAHSVRNRHFGSVTVNAPGVLLTMTGEPGMEAANAYFNGGLKGDGIVSNESEQVTTISPQGSGFVVPWPVFSGRLCGNITVSVLQNYTQTFAGSGTSPSTVKLGGTARLAQASIGGSFGGVTKAGSIGTGNYEIGKANTIGYCGLGETSPAKFVAKDDSSDDMTSLTFDGGTNGNLVLSGAVDVKKSRQNGVSLILDGNHSKICTFAARVNDIATHSPVVNIVKRGAGTWQMNANTNSLVTGSVTVEDGTLAFDSLGDIGVNCALGTAENLGDSMGAVMLGSVSTTGRLDYVGALAAGAMDRPIALVGTGALSSDSASSFSWSGVSAADADEHTLILDGSSTNAKLYNVTNGAGTVSIVKKGAGTWTLGGTLSFSGTVNVKEGSLVLSCATNHYKYFRLNLKERALGCKTADSGSADYNDISRWGLFDAAGKMQSGGITNNPATNGHPELLQPGEAALYSRRLNMNYSNISDGNGTVDRLFSTGKTGSFWRFSDLTLTTAERKVSPWIDRPETWMSIVVRLPDGAEPISSYDIGDRWESTHKYACYEFQTWSVDGSLDGLAWTELSSVVSNDVKGLSKQYNWRGKQMAYAEESEEIDTAGWPVTSGLIPKETLSKGLAGISVAAGASLSVDTDVVVHKIVVDAAGGGSVSGFTLADDGVVDVVGVPERGSFSVNLDLSRVNLPDELMILVNGKVDKRDVMLSKDRKNITGRAPGIVIIVE